MEHMIDPWQFVGLRGSVAPREEDPFLHEFDGMCVGVSRGFLRVRDMDDEVYEVEASQFTPGVARTRNPVAVKRGGGHVQCQD